MRTTHDRTDGSPWEWMPEKRMLSADICGWPYPSQPLYHFEIVVTRSRDGYPQRPMIMHNANATNAPRTDQGAAETPQSAVGTPQKSCHKLDRNGTLTKTHRVTTYPSPPTGNVEINTPSKPGATSSSTPLPHQQKGKIHICSCMHR